MDRLKYFTVFFIAVFAIRHPPGVITIKIRIYDRSRIRHDHSPPRIEAEKDSFHGTARHQKKLVNDLLVDSMVSSGNVQIHPNLNLQTQEMFSSSTFRSSHDSIESRKEEDMYSLIEDFMDLPIHDKIFEDPEAANLFEEMIETALDSSHLIIDDISFVIDELFDTRLIENESPGQENFQSSMTHIQELLPFRKTLAAPGEFFRDLPLDFKLSEKLISESRVKISHESLERLARRYQNRPRELMRKLFSELIPFEKLIFMRVSKSHKFPTVPENIRNAVEDFVHNVAEPKMTHREFMKSLSDHLEGLRRKKDFEKIIINKKSRDAVNDFSMDADFNDELISQSKVQISRDILERLVTRYKYQPRELMRQLFSEIIPREELMTLQATSRGGFKSIPENIRNAVEVYVGNVAEPKLTHQQFMSTIKDHLKKLRRSRKLSKIKIVPERS